MSATAQVNERLAALTAAGVSIWLDQIRRSMIESGELGRMIEEDSLRGFTSNPSIFEKAILGSADYDEDIVGMAGEGLDAQAMFERIAVRDLQLGTDVLHPVWEGTGGNDGFGSMEVGPSLARDTEATLAEARSYWERIDRPNLMIKIPGTPEGVPAIEQATYEGINVNVTLLFSVTAYAEVAEAYIRGLERRHAEGKSLDIHSVASFFVSRVDTEVDKRLEKLGRSDLAGRAALANARAAYRRFQEIFHGERFAVLLEAGAPVQRPLWASTGVKNPHYSDTMYVDGLVGPESVNTMPLATLQAAADHANITGEPTVLIDPTPDLEALRDAGIDLDDVTDQLLREGVELFQKAMDKLLAGVESKREAVITGRPTSFESVLPDELELAIAARVKRAIEEEVARRVWRRGESLWGGPGVPEIGNRLGWLTISDAMLEEAGDLMAWARACREDGLTDAVLLGMGGSSLAPEVIRRSFGEGEDALRLHVLDSTDPGAVLAVERSVDLDTTLFIVSSKSGGTIETLSHFGYFFERTGRDGARFVAVTDPGSGLAELGAEHEFRRVFLNDPDIGGRYSALSYFGLVPAALMGVDIGALLERAQVAEQACANYDSSSNNAGLWLGVAVGELALAGRDKVTFAVDEPVSSFGLWVEQLIAESTGKQGKGILPVADEPLGPPEAYGHDRVFIHLRDADQPDAGFAPAIAELGKAGHPVLTLNVDGGAVDLGRLFFFAEFATAVAGWVLGINPFDQPNVQEAKDNTAKVLEEYAAAGSLPEEPEAGEEELRALLAQAAPPHYLAILAFLAPSEELDAAVAELRAAIRDATGATTTFGYGPRYLHSTGQLHKGGPPTGLFLQLVGNGAEDVEIPEAGYTFGTLKNAQAIGDLRTLRSHGRPAERVRLEGDPAPGVRDLTARITDMLSKGER